MRVAFDSSLGGRGRAIAAAVAVAALVAVLLASAAAPAAGGGGRPHPRRAMTVRVGISDFAYHPPTLKVKRGTKVVFANGDRVPHTATRRGSFDTGKIRPGGSAAVRFKRRGVYAYVCTIHPFMHGKIVVR